MSSNTELICSVSSNGDCVALCSPDGVIKFYDALTSNLKLEYSSSTHLQANCTCLSWSKHKKKNVATSSKQKKVKTNIESIETELNDLDLIAIGTSQGTTLLYSLSKATLHSQLSKDGHADKVNDICWCSQYKDSLYSCSDDGQIVEWSIIESKMKNKWKGSKTSITSICLDPNSKHLISSSLTITIWDLETKTKLKTLTGHSNEIFKIAFLNNSIANLADGIFFSAANNDRIINAWSTGSKTTSTAALFSLAINDGPTYIDVASTNFKLNDQNDKNNEDTYALVCVVTAKGHLHIFNHQVSDNQNTNGKNKLKKPIKPIHQIQIETDEGNPLKIYGAFLTNDFNERMETFDALSKLEMFIVYGSNVNPIIEKLKFSDLKEQKIMLKREDPFKTNVRIEAQSLKIETPSVSKDLKVLVPGYMAPQTNNNLTTNNSKRKSIEPSQMSLEERLNVMGLDSNSNGDTLGPYLSENQIPKTDNLMVLLIQGLQSDDAKMLNHVLQHRNEKVIAKTLRLLPSNYVITLVKELNKRLQGHAQSGLGIVKWLKCTLMIHTSYLMSFPDLVDSLGSVYEMMNARTKLFPQLSKLQGKLQLVMSQVSSQAESQTNDKDGKPLLFYQDSNSEDEQFEEELIPSHSEFDDYPFSDEEESDDLDNEEMNEIK